MVEAIVEHEWKSEDGESVMKVVGGIIEMQKGGKLPQGFSLKGIQVLNGVNKAICNWEAPSVSALSELIGKVNPPTTHRVSGVTRTF